MQLDFFPVNTTARLSSTTIDGRSGTGTTSVHQSDKEKLGGINFSFFNWNFTR
jgi:hypothetical protein